MNASSLYRRILGLLAGVALLLSCLLFSGCRFSHLFGPIVLKDLFGEHLDQFPAVVLSADRPDTIDYKFDWNTTTIAGASITNFIPSTDYWRLNVFKFSDGKPISSNGFKSIKSEKSETFKGLPVGKLLRVDLDTADDPKGTKNRETYSFLVLFHNE